MTAVVPVTASGAAMADRLAAVVGGEAQATEGGVGETLRRLFREGRPLCVVGALGAVVRLLAPVISDKTVEPPVVCVAEDGSVVIPVLGGHRGANDLARRIAAALSVSPAVTTASDLAFGVALDAPPAGWVLAPNQDYKRFAAALLGGTPVRVEGAVDWLDGAALPRRDDAGLTIEATHLRREPAMGRLTYHPAVLAVGVGCERGCDPQELLRLVEETLESAGLSPHAVALVTSLDLKMDEPAVHAVAGDLGRPARFFDADRLEAETPRLANPSAVVFQEVGCHGVSEAAALAAAGPDAALLVGKRKSARATCAVALAPAPIDPEAVGTARGRLDLVGLGPGAVDWRTPEATAMLAGATDLVGYTLYLDQLGHLADGKVRHDFALGEEEARCRAALDLAAQGRRVALVSSGDIGIYAMASLVFELLDRGDGAGWRRVEVRTAPGVSALQACAARIGAPLGHDFCTISLSDLLTPWPVIRRRVEAAAAGDFVVAFYNPVSARRRSQLAEARAILLTARPPETPVVLGRSLGRAGESVRLTTLGELSVDEVDMMTVVLVGSSDTRRVGDRVYTPRGYRAKHAGEAGGGG